MSAVSSPYVSRISPSLLACCSALVTSGTSLSAQARYAAGTREILECFLEDRPIRDEYLIVKGGELAGTGARSYSAGSAARRASREADAAPS